LAALICEETPGCDFKQLLILRERRVLSAIYLAKNRGLNFQVKTQRRWRAIRRVL